MSVVGAFTQAEKPWLSGWSWLDCVGKSLAGGTSDHQEEHEEEEENHDRVPKEPREQAVTSAV